MKAIIKETFNWLTAIFMLMSLLGGFALIMAEVDTTNGLTNLIIVKIIGFTLAFTGGRIYNKKFK